MPQSEAELPDQVCIANQLLELVFKRRFFLEQCFQFVLVLNSKRYPP
jgi:hypothetical protein